MQKRRMIFNLSAEHKMKPGMKLVSQTAPACRKEPDSMRISLGAYDIQFENGGIRVIREVTGEPEFSNPAIARIAKAR